MRAIHRRPIYARFHALVALGFLFGVVYGAFSLTLPLLADKIFANIAIIGIVFALPELLGVFIDVPLGEFTKRFGRRKTIFYSGVLLALSAVLFIKFQNPAMFILVLLFYELATQAYIIPADAELMNLPPRHRIGKFHGIMEGFHNFGYAVGPIIAGWLLIYSFPAALWFAFTGAIVMIFISSWMLPREQASEPFFHSISDVWRRDKIFVTGIKEFRKLGFFAAYLMFLFFISSLHWGFNALLEPLYAINLGFSEKFVGLIFAGFTLPFLLVTYVAGKFVDQGQAKNITLSGLFLLAISMIGFGIAPPNPLILLIFALIHGVGEGLLLTAIMSIINELSEYHAKELISGTTALAESAGYLFGPLIAGISVAMIGFSPSFITLGLFTLALTVITKFVSFKTGAR